MKTKQSCLSCKQSNQTRKDEIFENQTLTRSLKLNYMCMCIFAFLTGCDFAVIIPTLWERLSIDYQATGTFMGIVISSYSFSGVLCGFVMGKLSDEVNRTKIFFIICVLFAIFGHIIYFFGISKYFILASRCIAGLSIGASPVALAYIARTTNEKLRTSVLSIIMASRQFGLMFGPAFNLFLRKFNFLLFGKFVCDRKSSPGLFMFILWSMYFLLILFVYKDKKAQKTRLNSGSKTNGEEILLSSTSDEETSTKLSQLKVPMSSWAAYKNEFFRIEILVLLSITFFTYFNQTSLETIVTPFTKAYFGWNELHNSILFCIGGCIIILSYVIVRLLSLKLKDKHVLLFGLICIFIGLTIGCICLPFGKAVQVAYNDNHTIFIINNSNLTKETDELYKENYKLFPAFVIFVFFDVLGLPAIAITSVSLFTKMVHNNMQGLGQGIQRGVLGIATIVGPLFAGPLINRPIVLIATTLCILFIIFIVIGFTFKHLKPLKTEAKLEIKTSNSDEC